MKREFLVLFLLNIVFFISCSNVTEIPKAYIETDTLPVIYPDYISVVIPPNIAPLNFNLPSVPDKAIVQIKGEKGGEVIQSANSEASFQFDINNWKELLNLNTDADILYTIYAKYGKNGWVKYPQFKIHVAPEQIDPYISYRLIEPGYVAYEDLGIYQRNLTDFIQTPIYTNSGNHCINCHTYQNRGTDRMLFHVRENHGGTVIVDGDKVEKINTKTDSTISACVYPSWHPVENKIAFSTNKTGQYFFLLNPERAEVIDVVSDLVLYDVDKKEVSPIVNEKGCLETFPSWSPKGDRLYYSSCRNLKDCEIYVKGLEDREKTIAKSFDTLFYDLWSIPYDMNTGKFGTPTPEYESSSLRKSSTLPRVSPDGKWLLFTLADRGQFHIWHKSSDLYLKDLINGDIRPLKNANSSDVESFHTWSSNGRWIIFSTRREDGCYTRPYICYFSPDGEDYKPFALPQKNPLLSKLLLKSYNLPEFMTSPVKIEESRFRDVVFKTEAIPVTFKSR